MPSKLELIAGGLAGAKDMHDAILPIFGKEDLQAHVKQVLSKDPKLLARIERNPHYMDILNEAVNEAYGKYGKYIAGAKAIDSWDRITSATGLVLQALEAVTGIGLPAALATGLVKEAVELGPKLLYAPTYAVMTGDYLSLPYFAAMEALSAVPVLGNILDFKNIYLNRARKRFQKSIKGRFMDKVEGRLEYALEDPERPAGIVREEAKLKALKERHELKKAA